MKKQTIVVSCPIDTYSGYGARSRDFVRSLLDLDKYDVKVLSQRWGGTRTGFLSDMKEDRLASTLIPELTYKPDIWVQVTVPNEFQKVGQFNIGLTAGIESTLVPIDWVEGCNKMDLILTSSQHSKQVFKESKYEQRDRNTQELVNIVEVKTPVEVLFEGVDIEKYTPLAFPTSINLRDITETFCFLVVGHWLEGDFSQDRKNIGGTVKTFLETFKDTATPPALILKTQTATTSIIDRERILDRIGAIRKTVKGRLPNIYLLHGDLSDAEMNELYNHGKVKAMVSLTRGEGFGRPLLEFSLVGKPIIATGWSGHTDFLDKQNAMLVGGRLENIHPSAANQFLLQEAKWLTFEESHAQTAFKSIYKNYKNHKLNSKKLAYRNRTQFSYEVMRDTLNDLLIQYIPQQVELNLNINNG